MTNLGIDLGDRDSLLFTSKHIYAGHVSLDMVRLKSKLIIVYWIMS